MFSAFSIVAAMSYRCSSSSRSCPPSSRPGRWGFSSSEFGSAGVGGEVDPVGGDGLGEDVDGGLFAVDDDERFVHAGAAGHRDVEVADVGGLVVEADPALDGAALGAHHGARVGKLDMLGHVGGGESDGAVVAGGGE